MMLLNQMICKTYMHFGSTLKIAFYKNPIWQVSKVVFGEGSL